MNKISDKKRLKQAVILQAAKAEFLSKGFRAANMDSISALAQVTKQTVYRYYSSKSELFKATLNYMGEFAHVNYYEHLKLTDGEKALEQFAVGFINAHLTDEHLAIYRLLISECISEPDIVNHFFEHGPDDTKEKLTHFFEQQLHIDNAESCIQLWCAMLLSIRHQALFGKDKPSKQAIATHVKECNRWLFASAMH